MRSRLSPKGAFFSFLALTLVACTGVGRTTLVEQRADGGLLIEPLRRAAEARGYETRYKEERVVKVALDREAGTWLTFQVKRKGVVMVARTDGERFTGDALEAELSRAEAIGDELLAEARTIEATLAEERRVREQAEAEAEAREAEERAARRAQRRERAAAALAALDDATTAPEEPQESGGSGVNVETNVTVRTNSEAPGSCCINGAFYECPSADSVYQCTGRTMECVQTNGADAVEHCLETYPPDPSGCSRTPGRDGEC